MTTRVRVYLSAICLLSATNFAHAGVTNWFRFDKTDNSDRIVRDTSAAMDLGHLVGNSTVRTTDRPLISDNGNIIVNNGAVTIGNTSNEGVLIDGVNFLLHNDGPAGTGSATLEFLIKPLENSADSLFWSNTFFNGTNSTIDGHDEADRFNIQSTFGSDHGANGDFRTGDPFSNPGSVGIGGLGGDTINQWVAYALVREHTGGDDYTWRWFRNGDEISSLSTTNEPLPSNTNSWSIGSRACCTLNALVDEVRFWDEALVHQDSRFLRVEAQSVSAISEWNSNFGGDWDVGANWTAGPADGKDQTARFAGAISQSHTVFQDRTVAIKEIEFENDAASYVLAGAGRIDLDDVDDVSASIAFTGGLGGEHSFQIPVQLNDDTSVTTGTGTLNFDNVVDLNGNALTTSGTVNFNHSVLSGGGSISGTGTIGTVGNTAIGGDVTLSSGVLSVAIGGTELNTFSDFNIGGTADLSGTIEVSLVDGFTLDGGETFEILSAGTLVDSGISLALTGDATLFNLAQTPGAGGTLVLNAAGGSSAGDFNNDGVVDAADYTTWMDNLGNPSESVINNAGDGLNGVNAADYGIWKTNFQAGVGAGSAAAVPEPSSFMLTLLVVASMFVKRRKS